MTGKLVMFSLLLGGVACAPKPDPFETHLVREMSFLQTGVDVDAERRAVVQALSGAGLEVVAELEADGVRALGAASPRFVKTAVRVVTTRGVVEGEDASRDDVLSPGRVHLIEDTPRGLEGLPVVGWLRLEEGTTAGCARLRVIDRQGRPRPITLQPSALFGTACAGGLMRSEAKLWGSLVWPASTAESTPVVEVPLAPVKGKLDSLEPVTTLALAKREGWLAQARERRLERLAEAPEFALRHGPALELAALAVFAGESTDAQRAAYTQHAGVPSAGFERRLWAESVALIERGWAASAQPCTQSTGAGDDEGEETPQPCEATGEPEPDDVLQEPVHGQEAQKEE